MNRSVNHSKTAILAIVAACGTYFCMYMFRKPFTAAKFSDIEHWDLGFKALLVITQVLGYTLSKFLGIKVVSETTKSNRAKTLLCLIGIAELALVGFAVTPMPWNFLWLFPNGLMLGMVFGLVISFLEGRKLTELFTAALCASFVFADGFAKSMGRWLLDQKFPEVQMPAIAGAIFLPVLGFFVWLLTRIPEPADADIIARSEREPIHQTERKALMKRYMGGVIPLVLLYSLVSILRGVRGDFAPEIWQAMQTTVESSVFATSELWAGALALAPFVLLPAIRNNWSAFRFGLFICFVGFVLVTLALFGWNLGKISPYLLMVGTGFGLYLPYFSIQVTVFERLVAITREKATIGYFVYVADAFGYAGYVLVLLARNFTAPSANSILPFFLNFCWLVVILGSVCLWPAYQFFKMKAKTLEIEASTSKIELL